MTLHFTNLFKYSALSNLLSLYLIYITPSISGASPLVLPIKYFLSNDIFSIEIPIDLNIAYGEYQNQSLCWTQPIMKKLER